MIQFEEGQVVELKSGGPRMVITAIIGSGKHPYDNLAKSQGYADGDVSCEWFYNNKRETAIFRASSIKISVDEITRVNLL